jgi:PKD repeat protein
MNKRLVSFLILFASFQVSFAQTATLSGVVNRYAAVTGIDTCSGRLAVSDTSGFQKGMAVLLIQMQGATVVSGNNFLYGLVQSMNFAGRYERALIDSVGPGALFVQKRLVNDFSVAGKLQVVSIPRYTDAVVADTLRCQPWDGSTGGVLALEVSGTLTLDAPLLADGAGFRGGAAYVGTGNNCNFLLPEIGYFYPFPNWRAAYKGEGIALPATGQELGRGPRANGGGGGNDHNAGGGGGANITDGGDGGDNDEPSALGCDGYYPGVRGYGIFFSEQRLFMGGGGGAGHANNNPGGAGARGGGIIYLEAGDIEGALPLISANGASAGFSNGDGAGGGGAGGSIRLKANSAPPGLILRANGGNGGNTINNNANRCFGPGGGGGGGRILTNLFGIAAPAGGLAGVVTGSGNACNGTSSGAGNGEPGLVDTLPPVPEGVSDYALPQIVGSPLPDSVCAGETASFIVLANPGNWAYQWQLNTGTGWQNINPGPPFAGVQDDTLLLTGVGAGQNNWQFQCLVQRPGCLTAVSGSASLSVVPSPTAVFTFTQNGLTVDFSNQSGADGWFWDFGDGNSSTLAEPQHIYTSEGVFTVTLYAFNDCDTAVATQTVATLLPPVAGFSVPPLTSGCDLATVQFVNTSTGTGASYAWTFGSGIPSTSSQQAPAVLYGATGIYPVTLIVTNAAGADTLTQFVAVDVLPQPVADFTFFVLPDGTVQFADLSQNADGLLWDFGDGNTSSEPDPAHLYNPDGDYIATLTVWNDCDTVTFQQTVPAFFPPTAGFFVPDTTPGCQTALVSFENTSSANSSNLNWEFPGGTPATGTGPNPEVTYAAAGTYTARLIASNSAGADTLEQSFTVLILGDPVAGFSYTPYPGGVLRFSNTSQDALNYTWDFGDGTPQVSNVPLIDHAFPASGVYVVTLIVSNPCGVSILQQSIEVTVSGASTGTAQGIGPVRIFPNPLDEGPLTLDFSRAHSLPLELQLWDAVGRLVFSQTLGESLLQEIAVPELPAGAYRLVLRFENGRLTRGLTKM